MNTSSNAIRDILKTAIQREKDSYNLYTNAMEMIEAQHARKTLQDLADQEVSHREKLEALLSGEALQSVSEAQSRQVEDLKITDYLVQVPLAPDSDFQDILIVAGKREKASHDLYTSLAQVSDDEDAVDLFQFLAREELTHKVRVERLYDDLVYQDN